MHKYDVGTNALNINNIIIIKLKLRNHLGGVRRFGALSERQNAFDGEEVLSRRLIVHDVRDARRANARARFALVYANSCDAHGPGGVTNGKPYIPIVRFEVLTRVAEGDDVEDVAQYVGR